jgi:hypothetical protein
MERSTNEDAERRAMAAYLRAGGLEKPVAETWEDDGKQYVVVKNQAGSVLVVYRVRANDQALRKMRRPPKELQG